MSEETKKTSPAAKDKAAETKKTATTAKGETKKATTKKPTTAKKADEVKEETAKKPTTAAKTATPAKKAPAKKAEETTAKKPTTVKKETAPKKEKAKPAAAEKAPKEEAKVEEAPVVEAVVEEKAPVEKVKEVVAPVAKTENELLTFITPKDDFDWSADSENFGEYTEAEEKELEELYSGTITVVERNDIVKGTVVTIGSKDVVLNIGFKSDGLVAVNEFRDMPDIKIGDEIEVFVEEREDAQGALVLSRKRAKVQRSWDTINSALEEDLIIEGTVKSRTKGGLIVDINGVEAFLPGSQIDIKPIRDYDAYVGKRMEYKVVKINHEFKNVVVSHKVLIEDDLESQKQEIISKLEKGQILEGVVKNITDFGVFIDLGGVDGLLHITDISWGRIDHPSEILELDQTINVVVLDFDDGKKRIALGLKQLNEHPWSALEESIVEGSKVKGKVVNIADYGAFIELLPGVEGLIHVSEMSWSSHLRSPDEFLKLGSEIDAVVLTIDREDRKMSLGMKQLTDDPWEGIEERFPLESKHSAKVKNMTNFGVFVEIEEGIDGLVHISDLSWTKKINHPKEFCKIDDKMDVVVLEVDKENRRLSLGHKQIEENPWDTFETIFYVGSTHEGTVIKAVDKGAQIGLPYGVEAFAPNKHLVKVDGSKVEVNEKLEFKVIEFNKDAKRIVASHARIHEEVKEAEVAKERSDKRVAHKTVNRGVKKVNDNSEKTTLGDLDVLSALKANMEKEEKGGAKKPSKKEDKDS
jgi:small subunit ribosomal protein S1